MRTCEGSWFECENDTLTSNDSTSRHEPFFPLLHLLTSRIICCPLLSSYNARTNAWWLRYCSSASALGSFKANTLYWQRNKTTNVLKQALNQLESQYTVLEVVASVSCSICQWHFFVLAQLKSRHTKSTQLHNTINSMCTKHFPCYSFSAAVPSELSKFEYILRQFASGDYTKIMSLSNVPKTNELSPKSRTWKGWKFICKG